MSRYPLSAYRQLFSTGRTSRGGPLRPADNCGHDCSQPHFHEWWYFDASLTDGSYLVAILHAALFNVGDHRPTVDLRYYPPQGAPVIAVGRFSPQAYRSEHDRFHVRIGACSAVELNGAYHLSVCQQPLAADLVLRPRLPGWRVGTGHLFADPAGDGYFDWIVPVPSAGVEGTLSVRGETRTVAGVGYHDHNWGNVYLPTVFDGWLWGRVSGGGWTLVFGDLAAPGGAPRVRPLLLGREGQVQALPWGFSWQSAEVAQGDPAGPAEQRRLALAAGDTSPIWLSLELHGPVDTAHFAALRPWLVPGRRAVEPLFHLAQPLPLLGPAARALLGTGNYRRWRAEGRLRVAHEETLVHGLVEQMDFGRGSASMVRSDK